MAKRLDYKAAAPEGMKALDAVYAYVAQCGLDRTLIDLVFLRASHINGCAYCIDLHTRDLLKRGVPVEKLALICVWREAEALFSDMEQAALAWAESVTNIAQSGAPGAAFDHARAYFGEKEMVDLTLAISLMNAYNRMAIAFRATPGAVREAKAPQGA